MRVFKFLIFLLVLAWFIILGTHYHRGITSEKLGNIALWVWFVSMMVTFVFALLSMASEKMGKIGIVVGLIQVFLFFTMIFFYHM